MTHETRNPTAVKELLDSDTGYVYVDVRTVTEFDQGHVPGAYNIPIAFQTAQGMLPNPDFLAAMQRHFGRDQKIVFG